MYTYLQVLFLWILGDSPDILEQLADGTHPFAKRLASAKKPAVIIGTEALQRFTLILIPVAVKQGHDL